MKRKTNTLVIFFVNELEYEVNRCKILDNFEASFTYQSE